MPDPAASIRSWLPNALGWLRIGLSLCLVPAALAQRRDVFWILLLSALASDALDGCLARLLHGRS